MHMRKATAAQHFWDIAKDSSEKRLTVNVVDQIGWRFSGIGTAENGPIRQFPHRKLTGSLLFRGSRLYSMESKLIEGIPYSLMQNRPLQYVQVASSVMMSLAAQQELRLASFWESCIIHCMSLYNPQNSYVAK